MKRDFIKIFLFLAILWVIHALQIVNAFDTNLFSTTPKNGIISIFTGVFLHANWLHIASNTASLVVSLPLLLKFYKDKSFLILSLGLIMPSVFVYFLGLNVIGISALCYALTWFIIFSGLKSKDSFKFLLSIVLAIFYADSLIGITPAAGLNISWQAHLGGFLTAIIVAFVKTPIEETN